MSERPPSRDAADGPKSRSPVREGDLPQEGPNPEEPLPAGHPKFCISPLDPLPCESSLGEWSPMLAPLVLGE